jgi:hypothetical protein
VSLVDLATARALIQTDVGDTGLQLLLDAAEAEIVARYGAIGTETYLHERTDLTLENPAWLFLPRRAASITTVTEVWGDEYSETTSVLDTTDYRIHYSGGALERLGNSTHPRWLWGHRVTVVYVPVDDTTRRKAVIVELVRLATRHSGVSSQNIGGDISENSYGDYILERRSIIESLGSAVDFS